MDYGAGARKTSSILTCSNVATTSSFLPLLSDPSGTDSRFRSQKEQLSSSPHRTQSHSSSSRTSTTKPFLNEETLNDFLRSTAEASYSRRDDRHQGDQRYNAGRSHCATLPHSRKRVGSLHQNETSGKRRPGSTASSPQMDRSVGSTSTNPIDLTSSPRRQMSSGLNGDDRQQGSSSIILPKWQPDEEVTCCPVCGTQFGILNRRHHCRKCGKVVCGGCSPHRITIPRQFIVYPPPSTTASPFAALGGSWDSNSSGPLTPSPHRPISHLSGGEIVRVCNPCVPDPNLSPPPQRQLPIQTSTQSDLLESSIHTDYSYGRRPRPSSTAFRRTSDVQRSYHRTHDSGTPSMPQYQPTRRPSARVSQDQTPSESTQSPLSRQHPGLRYNPSQSRNSFSDNHHLDLNHQRPSTVSTVHSRYVSPRAFLDSVAPPQSLPTHQNDDRVNHTSQRSISRWYVPNNPSSSGPQAFPAPWDPVPEAQRVVAEEDECPVCGIELPQKGPTGDETARTRHVQECLERYSVGSSSPTVRNASASNAPSGGPTSASAPSAPSSSILARFSDSGLHGPSASPFPTTHQGATQSVSSTSASTASLAATQLPAEAQPSVTQARRMTGGRMLVYRASEKDCVTEDGSPQECVICFEEFTVNDEMGRLECLCKFHKSCIRSWWETKGAGSCPTHQLHQ